MNLSSECSSAAVFRAQGFMLLDGCLSAEQSLQISAAFDMAMVDAMPFNQYGDGGSRTRSHAEDHPTLAALVAHESLLQGVQAVLRRSPLFLGSFLFDNRDDTPWHTGELPGEAQQAIRASVLLESAADSAGYLSIIPGSHHRDYSRALFSAYGFTKGRGLRLDLPPEGVPGTIRIPSEPRDVLLWDPRLWHSAWRRPDGKARRGIFLTYVPDPGDDKLHVEKLRRAIRSVLSFDRPYLYCETLREHAALRSMAERLEQLGVAKIWPVKAG